jgi:hypothetical protein
MANKKNKTGVSMRLDTLKSWIKTTIVITTIKNMDKSLWLKN